LVFIDLPLIIRISCYFGVLILAYAFIDVFFSSNHLNFDTINKKAFVLRSSINSKRVYKGTSVDLFKVQKERVLKTDDFEDSFNIVLHFDSKGFSTTYNLETFSFNQINAEKKVLEWRKKLSLISPN